MSRLRKYSKEMLVNLWEEYQKSGKKLKELCREKNLNYISIYTALRNNEITKYLKKDKDGKKIKKSEVKKETPKEAKVPVVTTETVGV